MATEVPAVSTAIRILEILARSWPDAVAPGALVNELKINRSTCYNIVGTLGEAGWVVSRDGRPGWTLGPRLLLITGVTDKVQNDIAQEELEALSGEFGFVVFVADRERGGGYRVIAAAEKTSGVRVTVSIGDEFLFSAPALMQSFLAWTDEEEIRRLVEEHGLIEFTPRSISDVSQLLDTLATVRGRGYAISLQQYNMAQGGVAAPMFDGNGRVSRVVCSLAFSSQLDETNVAAVGEAIRRCAEAITARTGGAAPPGYRSTERQ